MPAKSSAKDIQHNYRNDWIFLKTIDKKTFIQSDQLFSAFRAPLFCWMRPSTENDFVKRTTRNLRSSLLKTQKKLIKNNHILHNVIFETETWLKLQDRDYQIFRDQDSRLKTRERDGDSRPQNLWILPKFFKTPRHS